VESKLSPLGTSATEWPIVPAPDDYDDGEFGGMKIGRGNRCTRRKPASAPLCPQIPLHQTRVWTWAAAVGSQRLTAWAMARPCNWLTANSQKSMWAINSCPCSPWCNDRRYGWNLWRSRIRLTFAYRNSGNLPVLTCGLSATVARRAASCVTDTLRQRLSLFQIPDAQSFRQMSSIVRIDGLLHSGYLSLVPFLLHSP
jgi:hypothetical protein